MIDLRERDLRKTITSRGIEYPIDADFRTWIKFGYAYETEKVAIYDIFDDERPPYDDLEWVEEAVKFLDNPNATPRAIGQSSGERCIDLVLDGEYIVASFQHAYGIDLTDPDLTMHWHRFKALLNGLPDGTKMAEIMSFRSWRNSNRKHEQIMAESKRAWALPEIGEEDEMERAREIAAQWYEQQNGGEDA